MPAINVLENEDFDFKYPAAPASEDSFPIHWWGATVDEQGMVSLWRLTDTDPSRPIQLNTDESGDYDFARSPDGGPASVILEPTEVDAQGHLREFLHFDRSPIDVLDKWVSPVSTSPLPSSRTRCGAEAATRRSAASLCATPF